MNVNTKVEDLVMQKKKIENEKSTELFVKEIAINRKNKDYMIESVCTEMRQMGNRNKVLAEENNQLKLNIKELKTNLKLQ
jgi:hypothetical protein